MNKNNARQFTTFLVFLLFLGFCPTISSQNPLPEKQKSDFWRRVQFGGGLGLNFGSSYTNITVAPSAIYNFNRYFSAGAGLQYSYIKVRNNSDDYRSHMYGGSIISLFNPIPQIQLSAEMEQLRVNNSYEYITGDYKHNFWNTALFLGAGYRTNNLTIGARYNVLYNDDDKVYGNAFMPFVRVYF